MNSIDPQKAQRVWERVQSTRPITQEERSGNLQELILNEWTAAATYQQLARSMPAQQAAVLRRLAKEEHSHGACLRGMYSLITGEKWHLQQNNLPQEPVERTLRRCYGLEMRSLKEYEARSKDAEYGHIFARLAQQEQEHCMALLAIIGAQEKG